MEDVKNYWDRQSILHSDERSIAFTSFTKFKDANYLERWSKEWAPITKDILRKTFDKQIKLLKKAKRCYVDETFFVTPSHSISTVYHQCLF
jgi:hypothetical protein